MKHRYCKLCHLYYHNYNCYIHYIRHFDSSSENNRKPHKLDRDKEGNSKEFGLSRSHFSNKNLEIFLF
jgi:hypothetical protein